MEAEGSYIPGSSAQDRGIPEAMEFVKFVGSLCLYALQGRYIKVTSGGNLGRRKRIQGLYKVCKKVVSGYIPGI